MSKKGQAQSGRRYQNNAVDFSRDSRKGRPDVRIFTFKTDKEPKAALTRLDPHLGKPHSKGLESVESAVKLVQ